MAGNAAGLARRASSERHICDFLRLSCISFFSRFVAKRQGRRSADLAIVHSSSVLTSGQWSLVSSSSYHADVLLSAYSPIFIITQLLSDMLSI